MLDIREISVQIESLIDKNTIENIIISNPIKKSEDKANKVKVTPILLKDKLNYQISEYIGQKVIHKNTDTDNILTEILNINFKYNGRQF
ncbi:MAG: hypothetical protein KHZ95_03585 [Eubacterium sp.]|nr:hypothetical protein [Eubacterium sp.]